ncbi:MAG: Rrf2 family transcriptional regulator [Clostridia bacterium]|nr:Rrf2 family transcriptional regulator [Clostridia bacterium]
MRITQESDYALRIVTTMALHGDIIDASTISEETSVSQRFALKILNKLVKSKIISSYKGSKGGYTLAKSPSEITLKSVIELIDGPIAIARCVDSAENCSLKCDKTACVYHHIFDSISSDLARRLDNITISDMMNKITNRG